jgi:hypothetical protein
MSKLHCNDPDFTDGYRYQKSNFDKVKNIVADRLDAISKSIEYDNPNKHNSDCECGKDRVNLIGKQQVQPLKHPIVNLCMPYIESAFFQYDSAPNTNASIAFNNDKLGRIIKLTYFLDSGAGDNVVININKISANKGKESLINYVAGGNTFIKGTFIAQKLEFNLNMKIKNDEQIEISFVNGGANDITIMAIVDIKYSEEDFDGTIN